MPRLAVLTASLALAALASPAMAALPHGTLEYVQRTGTVGANDRIAVVMRLTLAEDSTPLTFSSDPLTGFAPEDIPTQGQFSKPDGTYELRDFASVSSAYLNTYYVWGGDFMVGCCDGQNYSFVFNTSSSAGHPSINFLTSFELAAGQSYEYTFGFFVPKAGGAAPGVYRWSGTGVTLHFNGMDAEGNFGTAGDAMDISTVYSLDPLVAFERTVVAVPEPGTYALLLTGLAVVGGFARRRSSQSN